MKIGGPRQIVAVTYMDLVPILAPTFFFDWTASPRHNVLHIYIFPADIQKYEPQPEILRNGLVL